MIDRPNLLDPANQRIRDLIRERYTKLPFDLHELRPWYWRPCTVRILMVADGALDFSMADFGLRTLLDIIHTSPYPHVRFQITVGHRNAGVSDAAVALGEPPVTRSIKGFRFDNPDHFAGNMYDQVWLFGIDTSSAMAGGTWSGAPGENELKALSEFMDSGGGLFATGDHGALGSALCGHVPRVRTMRRWFAGPGPFGNDGTPGMSDEHRHDTNRIGHDASTDFDDQSDDVPQPIRPRYFYARAGSWRRWRWPHPLLCGPMGVIDVMPDHPHEGECVLPYETGRSFTFGGYTLEEWPTDGSGRRVMPQLVSFNSVPAGNTASSKSPTEAKSFAGICAYDGDLTSVGRCVTDATWHHFININLIGTLFSADPVKQVGFAASPSGMAALDKIKAYYRNIAIWLSPVAKRQCMRNGGIWILLWESRLVEAVTDGHHLPLERADLTILCDIGRHARDAMGKFASQCQALTWILDWIKPILVKELVPHFDPWPPEFEKPIPQPGPDPVPWMDLGHLLDAATGGAILALRQEFSDPDSKTAERAQDAFEKVVRKGVEHGLALATKDLRRSSEKWMAMMK